MAEDDASRGAALQEVPVHRSVAHPCNEPLSEVIGELVFPDAITTADLAAFEASCAWCFQTHRVQLIKLFLSLDRKRAMMVFRAPDAESVRLVCRRAAIPVQRVWACDKRR